MAINYKDLSVFGYFLTNEAGHGIIKMGLD